MKITRDALAPQRVDQRHHLALLRHAQRGGGLVHDQHAAPSSRSRGRSPRLPLAARQRRAPGGPAWSRIRYPGASSARAPPRACAAGRSPAGRAAGASARGRGTRWRRHRDCRPAQGPGRSSRCRGRARRAGWRSCNGWPSNSSSPSSGGNTPEMILISVDLPAPLSPASATTSPGRSGEIDTLFQRMHAAEALGDVARFQQDRRRSSRGPPTVRWL